MKDNKSLNGLIIKTLNSKVELIKEITSLDEIKGIIKNDSFVIAYLDYKVLIGKYSNGGFAFYNNEQLEIDHLQRIRIFNNIGELMLWRSEGKFKGRYRNDNDGEAIDVVDNDQVLFGTKALEINGYTKLTEERGTEIILPLIGLNVDAGKNRIKIKTRNYIGFNEVHQATYIDNRFVEFVYCKNNNTSEVKS